MPKLHQQTGPKRDAEGGREIDLTFRVGENPPVPAILKLPVAATAVPAVLMIHGCSSSKEASRPAS